MKKGFFEGLLATAILLALVTVTVAGELPRPDGAALWDYISRVSPYTEWSYWPDHKGMLEGRAPHAPLHKVFVNSQALSSVGAPLNYGAIEVKENYGMDLELKAITVMYKVKGYNPKDGDWFWVKYSAGGATLKSGKLQGCIGCHVTRATNDYVLVHEFE